MNETREWLKACGWIALLITGPLFWIVGTVIIGLLAFYVPGLVYVLAALCVLRLMRDSSEHDNGVMRGKLAFMYGLVLFVAALTAIVHTKPLIWLFPNFVSNLAR